MPTSGPTLDKGWREIPGVKMPPLCYLLKLCESLRCPLRPHNMHTLRNIDTCASQKNKGPGNLDHQPELSSHSEYCGE